jgi:hypothetical protein
MTTIKVRIECAGTEPEEIQFDTFVQAVDYIRDVAGPTAEDCVICIDTRES